MRGLKLFLSSAILLAIGLVSLGSKWNGSFGVNAGTSLDSWAVSFNGSVHGFPALLGILAVAAGIVTFLIALIRSLIK